MPAAYDIIMVGLEEEKVKHELFCDIEFTQR